MTIKINVGPARVPAYTLVERLVAGLCLLYGCTADEVETIKAGPSNGILPVLASVRAGDGREVIRLNSITELADLVACQLSCSMLAKSVRRANEALA